MPKIKILVNESMSSQNKLVCALKSTYVDNFLWSLKQTHPRHFFWHGHNFLMLSTHINETALRWTPPGKRPCERTKII